MVKKQIYRVICFFITLFLSEYIFYKFGFKDIFRNAYIVIDKEFRSIFVWIFVIIICLFHYFYVIIKKNGTSKFFIKTSNDFLDLVSAFTTYSVVINSSLTLISGIIKEFIGDRKLFTSSTNFDFYTILASSFFPIIWAIMQLYSLLIECLKNEDVVTEVPVAGEDTHNE